MILNPAVRKAVFSGIFGVKRLKTIILTSIASQMTTMPKCTDVQDLVAAGNLSGYNKGTCDKPHQVTWKISDDIA